MKISVNSELNLKKWLKNYILSDTRTAVNSGDSKKQSDKL